MANEYLNYILEILEPAGEITSRPMFGGYCIYLNGLPSALIFDNTLYFKVDSSNRADYENAGSKPFTYTTKSGKISTISSWEVPLDVMEDHEEVIEWLNKSYSVALNAKRVKKGKKI